MEEPGSADSSFLTIYLPAAETGPIYRHQGERKDSKPPLKATISEIFPVTIIYCITYRGKFLAK